MRAKRVLTYKQRLALKINAFPRSVTYPYGIIKPGFANKQKAFTDKAVWSV